MSELPPRMGRPPKPADDPFCLEPLPVGCVVTGRLTLECVGLRENWPHRITAVEERALIPGRANAKRYFYAIDGAKQCLVSIEMIRPGGPVCAHPFPGQVEAA